MKKRCFGHKLQRILRSVARHPAHKHDPLLVDNLAEFNFRPPLLLVFLAKSPRRTGVPVPNFPPGKLFLKYRARNSGNTVSNKSTTMIYTKLQDTDMITEANDVHFAFFNPVMEPMLHGLDSAEHYSRTEGGSIKTRLGPRETAFIAGQDSFYIAAIGEDHLPYTQRRRGPKGFLRVLDATILGFASMVCSRRYISPGNALLFLIDHTLQARLKIWADAEVSEDRAMIEKLATARGHSRAMNLAFLFHVRAFSWNCEKHTVQRTASEVRSPEPLRKDKASPIQRTRLIEQKQTLLGSTCLGPASFAAEYANKI